MPKSAGRSKRARTKLTTNWMPIDPKRSIEAHITPIDACCPKEIVPKGIISIIVQT